MLVYNTVSLFRGHLKLLAVVLTLRACTTCFIDRQLTMKFLACETREQPDVLSEVDFDKFDDDIGSSYVPSLAPTPRSVPPPPPHPSSPSPLYFSANFFFALAILIPASLYNKVYDYSIRSYGGGAFRAGVEKDLFEKISWIKKGEVEVHGITWVFKEIGIAKGHNYSEKWELWEIEPQTIGSDLYLPCHVVFASRAYKPGRIPLTKSVFFFILHSMDSFPLLLMFRSSSGSQLHKPDFRWVLGLLEPEVCEREKIGILRDINQLLISTHQTLRSPAFFNTRQYRTIHLWI